MTEDVWEFADADATVTPVISAYSSGSIDVSGKEILFVDDAFFSGSTLLKTIKRYKELGAIRVIPCIVHICPLVASGEDRLKIALEELNGELVFSNTVWTRIGEGINTVVDCSPAIIEWIEKKKR